MKRTDIITMEYWMTEPPTEISINDYNQTFIHSHCFYLKQGEEQALVVKNNKTGQVFMAP